MNRPKVIIIGGGFGGLNAAKYLRKAAVDILLIDKTNHHLFQPLLYQVATAAISPGNIATPIREVLAKQKNTTVIMADIVAIDKDKKVVIAGNGEKFSFDFLIVACGSTHSYFGHPEWEAYAPGLKTIPDAITIRSKILLGYERAERSQCPAEKEKFMTSVIIGGGPTGVEMAGAIGELAHLSLKENFRSIDPQKTKIYLIEARDQLLPIFPKELGERAKKDLEALGVTVLLNTIVTDIKLEGVCLQDKYIETDTIIWAAGNQASPLLKSLDCPLDKFGRVLVGSNLTIPDYPNIFVIGDASCNHDSEGKTLPGIAPVAIQQGRYVARAIKRPRKHKKPFAYFDKGMMATIGKAKAVAVVGKIRITGFMAWLAWCFIHIVYLISFSNRALVLMQWLFLFLSNQRRIRIITSKITEEDEPLSNK